MTSLASNSRDSILNFFILFFEACTETGAVLSFLQKVPTLLNFSFKIGVLVKTLKTVAVTIFGHYFRSRMNLQHF
ncbi:MAG: hypothetical protein SVW57_13080, partial [Thermodesulfobacteriota bacterium]|nr:hypothetical protein [Thermodesulfobacteriota bacterium]